MYLQGQVVNRGNAHTSDAVMEMSIEQHTQVALQDDPQETKLCE